MIIKKSRWKYFVYWEIPTKQPTKPQVVFNPKLFKCTLKYNLEYKCVVMIRSSSERRFHIESRQLWISHVGPKKPRGRALLRSALWCVDFELRLAGFAGVWWLRFTATFVPPWVQYTHSKRQDWKCKRESTMPAKTSVQKIICFIPGYFEIITVFFCIYSRYF